LATFINTATLEASWHLVAENIQLVILALVTTYNLWFAYVYCRNPFRGEMWGVVGVVALWYCVAIGAGKAAITWTFPLFLFAPLNRKLNTLVGISKARLIRIYRLKRAAALLKSGQPVSDTAYQVGPQTFKFY
jgi:hypothetical protein